MKRWIPFVALLIPLLYHPACAPSIQDIPAVSGPAPAFLEKSPFTIQADSSYHKIPDEVTLPPPIQSDGEIDLPASESSYLAEGTAALGAGRFEEAYHLFKKGEEVEPWISDYHHFFRIKAHIGCGRLQAAVGMCLAFEGRFLESPLIPYITAAKADIFREMGADRLAIAAYERAIENHPDSGERAELLYKLGSLHEERDDLPSALSAYRRLREKYPHHRLSSDTRRKIQEIYSRAPDLTPRPSPEALFAEAALLRREGDYLSAARLFCKIEQDFSNYAKATKALYQGGICYARARHRKEALTVYERLAREHPDSREACPALYEAGRIHWNKDRTAKATSTFENILARYPRCKKAADAAFILGRIFQGEKKYDEAVKYYRLTYEKHPKSEYAPEALWREGWIHYLRGRYHEAATAFVTVEERFPDSHFVDNALYWQARSIDRLGNAASACVLYDRLTGRHRDTYYGILGEWRRGMLTSEPYERREAASSIAEKKDRSGRDRSEPLSEQASEAMDILRRARALLRVEKRALARMELRRIHRRSLDDTALEILLAHTYRKAGGYSRSIILAGSVYDRFHSGKIEDLPPGTLEGIYPLGYMDTISEHSMKHGLDPFLVAGVIRQESIFNPDCRSHAGALGLMQIIPSTGKRLSRQTGIEDFKNSQLLDPDLNIQLGTMYLTNLVERYEGDLTRVLAAYNAGEKAVEKWEKRFPHMERDEFAEMITYKETRNYVKLVIRNREMYRRIYSAETDSDRE